MNLKHKKYFNCEYPVICAGMNQVSNVKLALAIKQAGGYPSFVAFNHTRIDPTKPVNNGIPEYVFDTEILDAHLKAYYQAGGDRHYIMGVSTSILLRSAKTVKVLLDHRPAYIELYDLDHFDNPIFLSVIRTLKDNGIKILLKVLTIQLYFDLIDRLNKNPYANINQTIIDGIVIKGPNGAGRVASGETELVRDIKAVKAVVPYLIIVASGGIYRSADIIELQKAGADIVAIGTLFAVAAESSIPQHTKAKMIAASYDQIQPIGAANQNGIVFTKLDRDVENNTTGLRLGIHTGSRGHVFAGSAIDSVTEIKTVEQVMSDLTKGL